MKGVLVNLDDYGDIVQAYAKWDSLVGKLGENVSIRRFEKLNTSGRLAQYVHGGAKIGVLLDYTGGEEQLGRDLAMHVAAAKPVALSREQVPEDLIRKERDIAAAGSYDQPSVHQISYFDFDSVG